MSLTGLILAAGNGKRMLSDTPKVLHKVAGTPMIEWVIQALQKISSDQICIILSPNTAPFETLLAQYPNLNVCVQNHANGTAGAVAVAQSFFEGVSTIPYAQGQLWKGKKYRSQYVLVCAGDTPAMDVKELQNFIDFAKNKGSKLSVLGMLHPNPTGYGRLILSEQNSLLRIVEEKDTDSENRKINLCNTGIIFAEVEYLFKILQQVDNKNSQGEYYLTDCVHLAVKNGENVSVFVTDQWESFNGVNDKKQLEALSLWFHEKDKLGKMK